MPQFSRTTIVDLVEALFEAADEIALFLIRFDIDESYSRKVGLTRYLTENLDRTGPSGGNLIVEIIEYFVTRWCDSREDILEDRFSILVRSLKHDGYVVENGKLIPKASEV